jgi:hypothetical protein
MTFSDLQFEKCWKPDCMRKVKIGTQYCCRPCLYADEKKFELDDSPNAHPLLGHSKGCDGRKAERGEFTNSVEAWAYKQRGAP